MLHYNFLLWWYLYVGTAAINAKNVDYFHFAADPFGIFPQFVTFLVLKAPQSITILEFQGPTGP